MEHNYDYHDQLFRLITEKKGDTYTITFNDTTYTAHATEIKPGHLKLTLGDNTFKIIISEGKEEKYIFLDGHVYNIKRVLHKTKKREKKDEILSPISGRVTKVLVNEGAQVAKNQDLMIIEAMKMEYRIKAPYDGLVTKIHYKTHDQIDLGAKPLDLQKTGKVETHGNN